MLKLADDWLDIAKRAWSMRWMYLLAVFGALEAAVPFFVQGFSLSPVTSGGITLTITLAAMGSRLVYQSGLSKPKGDDEEPWI